MSKSKIEIDLEGIIDSAVKSALVNQRKKYEAWVSKDILKIFSTGDKRIIAGYLQILEKAHAYVIQKGVSSQEPSRHDISLRLKEDKARLLKVLSSYSIGQKIGREELAEKTGLTSRQLSGYAKASQPFIQRDGLGYTLARVIKKEVVGEKFVGETGTVHPDHTNYLDEKEGGQS